VYACEPTHQIADLPRQHQRLTTEEDQWHQQIPRAPRQRKPSKEIVYSSRQGHGAPSEWRL